MYSEKKINRKGTMPFIEHMRELRKRLILSIIIILAGTIVSFLFYHQIITYLFKPFAQLNIAYDANILYINSLFEGFLIKLKVSVICGVLLACPFLLYNIIRFIFPGLNKKEKKILIISLFTSILLVSISFYYGYYSIIPIAVKFLTSREVIPTKVGLLLNFEKNIFYIFQFLLVALIVFQTPIILELLMAMNLIKRKVLLSSSRFIVVAIFILSAVLTPPDIITQFGLALPLIILFYLTILIAKIFHFGED